MYTVQVQGPQGSVSKSQSSAGILKGQSSTSSLKGQSGSSSKQSHSHTPSSLPPIQPIEGLLTLNVL